MLIVRQLSANYKCNLFVNKNWLFINTIDLGLTTITANIKCQHQLPEQRIQYFKNAHSLIARLHRPVFNPLDVYTHTNYYNRTEVYQS